MMRRCILHWRDHAEATQLEIKMLWHHATCDIMTCRRLAWCMLFAHQADAAGGGCKCDGRGGGLTAALLCGIWCAAMLITASHHPPSLRIYHCLMIYPPSLPPPYPSPICSPPLCLIYWVKLQHEAAAAAAAALLSVWSLIADSHHFCQSQFIILNISLSHSIHLSLSLHSFVVVFFFFNGEEEVICGRDGADVGFDVDCSIPPSPSVTVYHFSPSALFLRPLMFI